MTLDQLRYFLAAAEHEHIHRAANSISISASVISQAVKSLEEELACTLFHREKKRLRLTQDGVRLLEHSKDVLSRVDGLRKEMSRKDLPLKGHFRVGASHSLATSVLTPLLSKMLDKHPELSVDVHSLASWDMIDQVLAGKLDFGLGFSPVPHPQLTLELVFTGINKIIVRKDHPIFERRAREHYKLLNDYAGTVHLATEKILMARHFPFLKSMQLDRKINFGFNSDFVAIENVRHSDNWALVLDMVYDENKKFVRDVPYPGESNSNYTVQIVKQKSRRTDAFLDEAFSAIRAHFLKLGDKIE